ncbi:MAG: hypothetical protein KFH98_13200, partial [Gemmatimonadetes bacterium]|nr:hypothetical protein [Gemmatimonadota bacterium]
VKCALSLHQWQDGEHADGIRRRITEMRSPPPPLDRAPDAALAVFMDEVQHVRDTVELVAGLGFVHAALVHAYAAHLSATNPLVDQPTRRVLRFSVLEEQEASAWYGAALAALCAHDAGAQDRARAWQRHLEAYLDAAGGIAGGAREQDAAAAGEAAAGEAAAGEASASPAVADESPAAAGSRRRQPTAAAKLPPARATAPFVADTTPRRDPRFTGVHQFEFPPQTVYNAPGVGADERNLALICRRALEMDVPETMASFMTERTDRPWEFHRDYGRQLWDEARHAMMGTVALNARGIDWTCLPLHVGFSLRLNLHAEPVERQILLYAIEQSLMPGDTGKRFEYETAVAAGDDLSAHFHDFDWADEVLHAQIGRRWMKAEGLTVQDAVQRGAEIHERTWPQLEQHSAPRDADPWQWWRDLVREQLGHESEAAPSKGPPPIVGQSG